MYLPRKTRELRVLPAEISYIVMFYTFLHTRNAAAFTAIVSLGEKRAALRETAIFIHVSRSLA